MFLLIINDLVSKNCALFAHYAAACCLSRYAFPGPLDAVPRSCSLNDFALFGRCEAGSFDAGGGGVALSTCGGGVDPNPEDDCCCAVFSLVFCSSKAIRSSRSRMYSLSAVAGVGMWPVLSNLPGIWLVFF